MKNSNNNTNYTNVIPNLFRNLKNIKILNLVQDDNTVVVQNDAKDKNGNELINLSTYRLIDFKKKFAFTLAETLITLGIIGIVAAMTIPTLLSNFTKQKLEEQIKVTYSSIQQTIKFMDDDGLAFSAFQDGSDAAMKEWFDMYLAQHMKTESVCINAPGCWHKYGVAKDLKGNLNFWDRSNNIGWGYNIITFTTAKGAWFDMDGHMAAVCKGTFGINTDDKCLVIYFDANGDRKPNRIGKDIHIVVWTEDGLVPAGSDKTTAEVKQNCTKGNGYWCLQEIINDSWKIPDSVWKR